MELQHGNGKLFRQPGVSVIGQCVFSWWVAFLASAISRKCLAGWLQDKASALGPDHPQTQSARKLLASFYLKSQSQRWGRGSKGHGASSGVSSFSPTAAEALSPPGPFQ